MSFMLQLMDGRLLSLSLPSKHIFKRLHEKTEVKGLLLRSRPVATMLQGCFCLPRLCLDINLRSSLKTRSLCPHTRWAWLASLHRNFCQRGSLPHAPNLPVCPPAAQRQNSTRMFVSEQREGDQFSEKGGAGWALFSSWQCF